MTGIFVDRWRVGLHSEKEVDELLLFCRQANISDIFAHYHSDRAVSHNWDYLGYLLRNNGGINVHAWVSLTVGRDNSWTRNATHGMAVIKGDGEKKDILMLDPTHEPTADLFVEKIQSLVLNYPTLHGISVDRLRYPAGIHKSGTPIASLVSKIRSVTLGKHLSAPVMLLDPEWKRWDLDEVIPMFIGYQRKQFDKIDLSVFSRIALGCYGCNVATTTDQIRQVLRHGVEPILYSYGAYTFNPKETREDFLKAINAVS